MASSRLVRRFVPLAWLAACGLLAGCRSAAPAPALRRYEFKSPHMGTLFTIKLYAPDPVTATNAAAAAARRITELDRMMTDYDPESELMKLCQRPVGEPTPVSADLFDVLSEALRIAAKSNGAFDPTVGPYVRLWRRSRRTGELPPPGALARAGESVGYQHLRLDARHRTVTLLVPHMQLDLGGIAKGFAADQALAVLRRFGITRALVAASGDIALGDPPPGKPGWQIGIGAVDAPEAQIGRQLCLSRAGVSTSGDTEQFVEIGGAHYSHILDPRTGLGLTNRIQATVIAPRATLTDALATTVCVLGAGPGLALIDQLPGTGALLVVKEGERQSVLTSRRFGQLSPSENR